MNALMWIGVCFIAAALFGGAGAYVGRTGMLKDFGMTWSDYFKHLNGRRPH